MKNNQIEEIFQSNGFTDYKFVNPQNDIILAHWVRFKCMFGCKGYGQCGSCPTSVPSVDECHKMIREYKNAAILHFNYISQTKEERHKMLEDILNLEREIFITGYYKAFMLPHHSCDFCEKCIAKGDRIACVNKTKCRPTPEAMGIDIFQTVRNAGYTIEVLENKGDAMNRYSFILID